jgi:hypothetical protein
MTIVLEYKSYNMAEAYSVDRSKAVKSTIDSVRPKNTTRRVVEITQHVDPLSVINKLALAGMFGALGEAYAVTPDNPNPAMAVAITLLFVAAISKAYSRFGFNRV